MFLFPVPLINSGVAVVYDTSTAAWIAAVGGNGGTVSSPRKTLVDNLIVGLKNDGVWSKLDRLWLFAAENENAGEVDLVATDIAVPNNSPTFTPDDGYTTVGATPSYINTTFVPSTDGIAWSQDSASMSVWTLSTISQGVTGAYDGGSVQVLIYGSGGTIRGQLNDLAEVDSGLATSTTGLITFTRTGSNSRSFYSNGSAVVSGATGASAGNINLSLYAGCRNIANAPSFGGNGDIASLIYGGGLNSTEAGNLYSRLRTYMTAVGVP